MSKYKNPTCRGSYAFGSACGKCERCAEELAKLGKPMTNDNGELKAFEREERYIVVKIKDLGKDRLKAVRDTLYSNAIKTVECVVIESDWACYEDAWKLVEQEYTGTRPDSRDDVIPFVTHEVASILQVLTHWKTLQVDLLNDELLNISQEEFNKILDTCITALSQASGNGDKDAPEDSYILVYDDTDKKQIEFLGAGAKQAAFLKYQTDRDHWSCHLFQCIKSSVHHSEPAKPKAEDGETPVIGWLEELLQTGKLTYSEEGWIWEAIRTIRNLSSSQSGVDDELPTGTPSVIDHYRDEF